MVVTCVTSGRQTCARVATVVRAHWLVMAALDYGKWDDLYDSDEERQKDKRAEEAKRKADLRKAQLNPQPQQIPGGMTEEQFAAQYAKMFKQPATQQKEPYKFPETMEEQRAKCDEANELKRRGNELYQKGESPTVEDKATWPGQRPDRPIGRGWPKPGAA